MLRSLPAPLRGVVTSLLLALNTLLWSLPMFALAPLKLLPWPAARGLARRLIGAAGECWADCNRLWIDAVGDTRWQLDGVAGLRLRGSCLVIANHQSWVDIFVLQYHLNRRLPLLRFFIKRELFWIPVFGQCCWALDFPFMRRHSAAYLARHPERRSDDLRNAQRATHLRAAARRTGGAAGAELVSGRDDAAAQPLGAAGPPRLRGGGAAPEAGAGRGAGPSLRP